MNRVSRSLSAVMHALYAVTAAAALAAGTIYPGHKSYIIALAAGLPAAGLALLIFRGGRERHISAEGGFSAKDCLLLTALCLAVNGAAVCLLRVEPSADFGTNFRYALQLAGDGDRYNSYIVLFPHIFGYSYFLSLPIRLFGSPQLLVPALNVLFTCLTGILIYAVCSAEISGRAGRAAYLMWIFLPSKAVFNAMVLPEPVYTFLAVLFIFIVVKTDRITEGTRSSLLSGALAGIAAGLVLAAFNAMRPVAIVLIVAFIIWLALLRGGRPEGRAGRKTLLPFAVCMIAVYIISTNAWTSFVDDTLGEKTASYPGYNIYVGLNPETNGSYSADDMELLSEYYYNRGMSADEAEKHLLEGAKERVRSGKIDVPVFVKEKIRKLLGNDEAAVYYASASLTERQYSVLCIISNAYYYMLVLLSLYGVFITLREKRLSPLQLAPLYVFGLTLGHMAAEVAGRYHYSMLPMIIICAAPVFEAEWVNKV